jgi:hypothetical protein
MVEAVLQAISASAGSWRSISPEQRNNPVAKRVLLPAAIGKAGVIGDIDETPPGHDHPGLAQHAQPADAAVKDQNRPLAHDGPPPFVRLVGANAGPRPPLRSNRSKEAKTPRSTLISSVENPGRVSTARKIVDRLHPLVFGAEIAARIQTLLDLAEQAMQIGLSAPARPRCLKGGLMRFERPDFIHS